MADKMVGKIRSIRDDRDFAFIVSGANRDIFLHKEQYLGDWDELLALWKMGPVTVAFNIYEGPKGLKAINCEVKL
jgi:cold shock CspA family protein